MARVLLLSTYEMGRQPFGLASPAAWLRDAGCDVTALDLSRQPLDPDAVRAAHLVAIYLPMHTATRLAGPVIARVRALNPAARLCAYGLYAPLNESHLRALGVAMILGAEFEAELVELALAFAARDSGVSSAPPSSASPSSASLPRGAGTLPRLAFRVPDRRMLPALTRYARLHVGADDVRTVGYTEATRGCKHLCRHCPIVPIYGGQFRVVPVDVVIADVRQQVETGASHVTFGDPDFFNGPRHAMAIVERFAAEFPGVTYDVTIKIEHLLKHRALLPRLRETGCLFVTSAVEAVDDRILAKLAKGHTRADFVEAVALCREAGLTLAPTFVAFTPWTTIEGYGALLHALRELDLIEHVPSIQLAIRLLIPDGSLLLELDDIRALVGPFDAASLVHPWRHPDPRVDALQEQIARLVGRNLRRSRTAVFDQVEALVRAAAGETEGESEIVRRPSGPAIVRAAVPYLDEPWYC
jgi:radical SAM superfamily enzyme YgiQ (UPF0313 family)